MYVCHMLHTTQLTAFDGMFVGNDVGTVVEVSKVKSVRLSALAALPAASLNVSVHA